MKLHKIRNVALEECCAEQKIAYNIAFRCDTTCGHRYNELLKEDPEAAAALLEEVKEIHLGSWDRDYASYSRKYDRDVIVACLEAGLANYLKNFFIATRYEQIGKAFPLPADVR